MVKHKIKVPVAKADPDIDDLKAKLDRQSKHYALVNFNTGDGLGANLDQAVPMASVTKWFTAAAIINAKGDKFEEFLRAPAPVEKRTVGRGRNQHVITVKLPSNAEMFARFLARSDNSMGPALAERAFGHDGRETVQAFYNLKQKLGLKSWQIKDQLGIRNFTTGLNDDGQGPMASPTDIAKVAKFIYDHGGEKFLRRFANPNGSGIGHTMPYAFNHTGLDVIGCKSGTNPRAGDVTALCVFKNKKTGDVYAGFMHTNSSGNRPGLLAALETMGEKFDETRKRVGDGLRQFGDDLVAMPKKIADTVAEPIKSAVAKLDKPPTPPRDVRHPAATAAAAPPPAPTATAKTSVPAVPEADKWLEAVQANIHTRSETLEAKADLLGHLQHAARGDKYTKLKYDPGEFENRKGLQRTMLARLGAERVEKILRDHHLDPHFKIDGRFGDQTRVVEKVFADEVGRTQRAAGANEDRVIGANTVRKLQTASGDPKKNKQDAGLHLPNLPAHA